MFEKNKVFGGLMGVTGRASLTKGGAGEKSDGDCRTCGKRRSKIKIEVDKVPALDSILRVCWFFGRKGDMRYS